MDGPNVTEHTATQQTAPSAVVMLLGAEQRSRELALAFQRLGAEVIVADRHADALTDLIDARKPTYVVAYAGAVAATAMRGLR